ncbi:MAG: lipase [Pirellula sp.]|nr:lipase [Pirellula sp.]
MRLFNSVPFRASFCCIVLALVCEFATAQAPQADKSKAKKAAALPVGVRVERDLEYARRGEQRMLLDLYLPEKASEGPLPVVVWVHGGGWSAGSKDRCPATFLAAEGFAVASINYRLSQEARWPAQIDDCREAIRWLRKEAKARGFDAEHIGVWGGSAGGHLVALLGTLDVPSDEATSSRVQAVCDWYGPSDLLTMPPNVLSAGKTEADLAKANGAKLLGGIVRDRPELARQASAFYQASAGDAPFLIMHGDADPQVPLEQSERLHNALTKAGVSSTFQVMSGGHGGPAFQTEDSKQLVLAFFRKHLSR